ncbi:acetyl-CoA carboxylase carboxyltransferase subunit alpha [Tannockella kyphosi]|uniref:acetyl-CoA carboxylase carboxyltransferase subunit alpha n=1 Tax=Tannockella kyphosi TaxID=2899121 RepID=UPI002010EA5C|nr:acetyl-CoA carboxylase carboxyltransferase subunit alpha [Tannockella kyphosi]
MSLQEKEKEINKIMQQIEYLQQENKDSNIDTIHALKQVVELKTKDAYLHLSNYDRVYLARKTTRPNVYEYIEAIFDDFIELHGDRLNQEDSSLVTGLALLGNMPVTVIGHRKGRTLEENMECNFGMSRPEGYRKALRLMHQANKFHRPIITFIDTPGAYPGKQAEENGIGEAIARNLMEMSTLEVPIIVVVIGEGGSGGALALSVGDKIVMLENSVYSILSPEGFASILWKDGSRASEAAELMKLTAKDLKEMQIIDDIILEPTTGITIQDTEVFLTIRKYIEENILSLRQLSTKTLIEKRYEKFRKIGGEDIVK